MTTAAPAIRPTSFSPISAIAIVVAAVVFLPVVYVTLTAMGADATVWSRLWRTRVPELLANTAALAAGVAAGTVLLGVSLAWLVMRYDFPGRRVWEWALVLPLTMPTYVLAYVYSYVLSDGGLLPLFRPQSYAGVVLVMTLDTFPFVYLLTRAALQNLNASYEEVARACGASRAAVVRRVTLPLLRPAIVAGLSLVLLYVVSDFGAVSLLRYQTFTYAVYQQMTGRYDYTAAAILSLLLVALAAVFLTGERWFRRRSRFYQTGGRFRTAPRTPLSGLKAAAASAYPAVITVLSFGLPAALLMGWSAEAIAQGALDLRFIRFIGNSALLSALAATAAVLLAAPLAYLAVRRPSWLNTVSLQAAYAGYVLPGPVGALAILMLFSHLAPFWYGSIGVLIVAYVVHFLPAGLQTLEPSLQQVTPNLEEAARSLGRTMTDTLRTVTLPLVRGGFVVAWVLMFLQCVKELPATLLLRPVGFDTLAVRVWLEASEEYYQLAAPSALLIVLITLPAIWLLVSKDWRAA